MELYEDFARPWQRSLVLVGVVRLRRLAGNADLMTTGDWQEVPLECGLLLNAALQEQVRIGCAWIADVDLALPWEVSRKSPAGLRNSQPAVLIDEVHCCLTALPIAAGTDLTRLTGRGVR